MSVCPGTGHLPRSMGERLSDGTVTGLCISCMTFQPMDEVIPPSRPEWPREFRLRSHAPIVSVRPEELPEASRMAPNLPYITRGSSSEECLDSGWNCSIDPMTGRCTECDRREDA